MMMKCKYYVLVFTFGLCTLCSGLRAQQDAQIQGGPVYHQLLIDVGTSFGYFRYLNYTKANQPGELSVAYGLNNWWSMRLGLGYQGRDYQFVGYKQNPHGTIYEIERTYTTVGMRSSIHWSAFLPLKSKRWDIYTTGLAGVTFATEKRLFNERDVTIDYSHYEGEEDIMPFWGLVMGCRFFATEQAGLMLEAGAGQTGMLRVGLSLSL